MPRVSYYTGKYTSLLEGIREDIFSRCLTIAGERWWHERYGSRLFEIIRGNLNAGVLEQLRSEIRLVLAPARDLYYVQSIEVRGLESRIKVSITVIPLPEQQESFEVSFTVGG